MAILDPNAIIRHEIPHEPGEWIEVRPLTPAQLRGISTEGDRMDVRIAVVVAALKGWSYEAPVTGDMVSRLDLSTFEFVEEAVRKTSGIRSEAEKKGSTSNSSATTGPGAAASPASSTT